MRTFRLLIMAAGDGKRWGNYQGTPKHLVEIDGEPLLHRTVRLFAQYTDEIVVVGDSARYAVEGASLWRPQRMPELVDCQKYFDARAVWPDDESTMLVFGDCWYSEQAVEIIALDPQREVQNLSYAFFGRRGASAHTGKPYGELFAVRLDTTVYDTVLDEARRQAEMRRAGVLRRNAGWELYRGLVGLDPAGKHAVTTHFVEINDRTEDFDYPYDLDRWRALG